MVQMTERQLAIVLLDLIGSTAFVQRMGAMKSAQWLQYHDRETRSLLYKFSGREIDRSDGFMLSFENIVDAVNFGLWYQKTIPLKTKLNTRIGIHWGTVVEVQQDEMYTLANAKTIELEGIAKNVTARTMSVCRAGQVLLTKEAFIAVRNRTNSFTPSNTRYACVGLYRFKGVREPVQLYAVGETIESLQPPPSSEKAKRLGGAKRIKSRMRDRQFKEWCVWFSVRVAWLSVFWLWWLVYPAILSEHARRMSGVNGYLWWIDSIVSFFEFCKQLLLGGL
jgi:class 3 adenylate cyclase